MLWHLVICLSCVSLVLSRPISYYNNTGPSSDVAFAFAGAGGRLGQQVALAEALINGSYPNGTPIRPSYFTGVSSGAIVTVAMSAILETMDQDLKDGLTFGEFHSIMFNMRNSDIYKYNIFKVVQHVKDGYLLDTTPLKNFLTKVLNRIGYSTLGDLYIPTTITTVDQRTGASVRLSSINPLHSSLSLFDVLRCSAAIPVAFEPGTLPQLSKYSHFVDGATGIDAIPVVPLFDVAGLQKAYVITYNFALTPGTQDKSMQQAFEPADNTLLQFALQAFDILRVNVGIGSISILRQASFAGYIYEPTFTTAFSTVDFNQEEAQYNLAREWASEHDPIPVDLYTSRTSFHPNYTLIDEELANSSSSPPPLSSSFGCTTLLLGCLFVVSVI